MGLVGELVTDDAGELRRRIRQLNSNVGLRADLFGRLERSQPLALRQRFTAAHGFDAGQTRVSRQQALLDRRGQPNRKLLFRDGATEAHGSGVTDHFNDGPEAEGRRASPQQTRRPPGQIHSQQRQPQPSPAQEDRHEGHRRRRLRLRRSDSQLLLDARLALGLGCGAKNAVHTELIIPWFG